MIPKPQYTANNQIIVYHQPCHYLVYNKHTYYIAILQISKFLQNDQFVKFLTPSCTSVSSHFLQSVQLGTIIFTFVKFLTPSCTSVSSHFLQSVQLGTIIFTFGKFLTPSCTSVNSKKNHYDKFYNSDIL